MANVISNEWFSIGSEVLGSHLRRGEIATRKIAELWGCAPNKEEYTQYERRVKQFETSRY